jgi:hypothetical protein
VKKFKRKRELYIALFIYVFFLFAVGISIGLLIYKYNDNNDSPSVVPNTSAAETTVASAGNDPTASPRTSPSPSPTPKPVPPVAADKDNLINKIAFKYDININGKILKKLVQRQTYYSEILIHIQSCLE